MLGLPFRLLYDLVAFLLAALANAMRALRRRPRYVQVLLEGEIPERAPPMPRFLLRRRRPLTVARLAEELAPALADPRVEGVLVVLRGLRGGWASLDALRLALAAIRGHGKRLVVHLSSPSLRDYFVATAAQEIVMDESAPLPLIGFLAETTLFGAALARAGVAAELAQREEYKSFAETFTRHELSGPAREQIERMLDVIEGEVAEAVADSRGVDADAARALLEGGPYEPEAAVAARAIDRVEDLETLRERLAEVTPTEKVARREAAARRVVRPLDDYLARRPHWPRWRPLLRRARRVAVLRAHGAIVPGEGGRHVALGPLCGADALRRAIAAARRDGRVAAVVLHVDSRGGAANASELIWREVARLGEAKPVVACFGDVAASGGYYVGAGASRIVAGRLSVTGSIGVVAGKLSFGGVYERFGVGKAFVQRGAAATMFSPGRAYEAEERRRLEAEIEGRYRLFLDRVARGRKLEPEAARSAARGRVWMGVDARERRLVDDLGTLADAVEAARILGRRRPGERLEIVDVPVRPRGGSLLQRLLAGAMAADPLLGPALRSLDSKVLTAALADAGPLALADPPAIVC